MAEKAAGATVDEGKMRQSQPVVLASRYMSGDAPPKPKMDSDNVPWSERTIDGKKEEYKIVNGQEIIHLITAPLRPDEIAKARARRPPPPTGAFMAEGEWYSLDFPYHKLGQETPSEPQGLPPPPPVVNGSQIDRGPSLPPAQVDDDDVPELVENFEICQDPPIHTRR
jgi:hypothetical protein